MLSALSVLRNTPVTSQAPFLSIVANFFNFQFLVLKFAFLYLFLCTCVYTWKSPLSVWLSSAGFIYSKQEDFHWSQWFFILLLGRLLKRPLKHSPPCDRQGRTCFHAELLLAKQTPKTCLTSCNHSPSNRASETHTELRNHLKLRFSDATEPTLENCTHKPICS